MWTQYDSCAPTPGSVPEFAERSQESLALELAGLRERGEQLLFDSISLESDHPYATWIGREGVGLARIVDRRSPWTELPRQREGGAYWSFVRRSHDYNHDPDLGLEGGIFKSGFVVRRFGTVVDLGERPMPSTLESLQALPNTPAVELALTATIDRLRSEDEVEARVDELETLRNEHTDWHSVKARPGHSYLVRSMLPEHDVLAVFEVLELDERGALIAWRVLRSLPVARRP